MAGRECIILSPTDRWLSASFSASHVFLSFYGEEKSKDFLLNVHTLKKLLETMSAQSCPTLCNPTDCRLPGSSVHGCPRQEYWSGLSLPPPGDLPDPAIKPASAGGFFTTSSTWEETVELHKPTLLKLCCM